MTALNGGYVLPKQTVIYASRQTPRRPMLPLDHQTHCDRSGAVSGRSTLLVKGRPVRRPLHTFDS